MNSGKGFQFGTDWRWQMPRFSCLSVPTAHFAIVMFAYQNDLTKLGKFSTNNTLLSFRTACISPYTKCLMSMSVCLVWGSLPWVGLISVSHPGDAKCRLLRVSRHAVFAALACTLQPPSPQQVENVQTGLFIRLSMIDGITGAALLESRTTFDSSSHRLSKLLL